MSGNRRTKRFWFVLTGVNLLALSYPVMLFCLAKNAGGSAVFCAILVLIGCVLLLTVVDVVSLCVSHEFANLSVADGESRNDRNVLLVSDFAALPANIARPAGIQR